MILYKPEDRDVEYDKASRSEVVCFLLFFVLSTNAHGVGRKSPRGLRRRLMI